MQLSKEEKLRRPNIIHIFMESMCYNDIAALGNNEVITPNLDRLVRMGTTMTNAYNQEDALHGAIAVQSSRGSWHSQGV